MASSLRAIVSYASSFVSQLPLFGSGTLRHVSPYEPLSAAPQCPLAGPVSCSNTTLVAGDPCCFVHPAGRIVLAQVWDAEIHAPDAEEDWMLCGLWYVCHGGKCPPPLPWGWLGIGQEEPTHVWSAHLTTSL